MDDIKDKYESIQCHFVEKGWKKELMDIKGGAKKLPKWAQKTLPEFAILDYELLSDKIYDYYSEHISYMLTLIYNTNYLLGKSQRIYILKQFKELTKQKTSLENVRLNIPQPITLSKELDGCEIYVPDPPPSDLP